LPDYTAAQLTLRFLREGRHAYIQGSGRRPDLAVGYLGSIGPSVAQTQACEPDKIATKYPSRAGKTIKIGADPTSPPYVTRDPKDFHQLIGFDTDLARAVFDCAGVKYEFFFGGWSGLLPAVISGQIDVMWDNLYYTAERATQVD